MIPTLAAIISVLSELMESGPKSNKDVRRVSVDPLIAAPWIILGGTFLAMVGLMTVGVSRSVANSVR